MYRGGQTPARLRRVVELADAKTDVELTLAEMAESAGLSTAHFSRAFRKSTGESPYQFVTAAHGTSEGYAVIRRD
jgi:AraC family transcriptional regulator